MFELTTKNISNNKQRKEKTMKNNKFTKISLIILTLALSLGVAFAMSIGAEEPSAQNTENGPAIISQNIQYSEMFRLMYAVDPATVVDSTAAITLNVYDVDPEENIAALPVATMTAKATSDEKALGALKDKGYTSAYIFTTTKGVSYSNMLQNFYAQVVDSDGTTKSAVKRYSVAEYFYEKLASNPTDADAKAVYENAIAFGASVQTLLAKENGTDPTLVSDVRYVVVEEGLLDGKYTAGVYEKGTALDLDVVGGIGAKWTVVAYDAGGAELSKLTDQTTVTVPEAENVAKLFVTSGTVISYREGYNNFNTLTEVPSYITKFGGWYGLEPELKSDSTRGNYIFQDLVNPNPGSSDIGMSMDITSNPDLCDETITSENASAYEISFDLKLTSPGTANEMIYFRFIDNTRSDASHDGNTITSIYLYTRHSSDPENSLRIITSTGATGDRAVVENVDMSGWNHFRFVLTKGDENNTLGKLLIYINGGTTPVEYTISNSKSVDWDDFSYLKISNAKNYTENTTVSIDNLYMGFVK